MSDPMTNSDAEKREAESRPTRVYTDAEGQRWQVYEKAFAPFDRRSGMSLIFASEGAMRRVRNYPANWLELSNEELSALSWSA